MCVHIYEVYIDAHLKVFQFRLPHFFSLMRFSFNFHFPSSLPSQQYKLHPVGVSCLCLFYLGIFGCHPLYFPWLIFGIWKHVRPVAHLAILGSMRKISKKENIKISPLLHLPMGFHLAFLVPGHFWYLMSFLGEGISLCKS